MNKGNGNRGRFSISVPSLIHRSGDSLLVRSVVSGDTMFDPADAVEDVEYSDDFLESCDDKDLPECNIRKNYLCNSCNYLTQNHRHYLYHLRDDHQEKIKIFECSHCLYASKYYSKLIRHSKMMHGETERMEVPEFSRTKSRKRKSHYEDVNEVAENVIGVDTDDEEFKSGVGSADQVVYKCLLCTFTARNQIHLSKHEREEHIDTKFFGCTKCTYVTQIKARFSKHVKHHSMPMIKCDMCDFLTPYKCNLNRHCENHNGRGAFRCSACNYTVDIKRSLAFHEINHHIPPVRQAARLGAEQRRNKVGASNSAADEEVVQLPQSEPEPSVTAAVDSDKKTSDHNLKMPAKKSKRANIQEPQSRDYGSDFIHPDDIVQHANGNIYIKNKCKLCSYKTAWDGEMAKHELKVHNIVRAEIKKVVAKKPSRPIPNLIPIPTQTSVTKLRLDKVPVDRLSAPAVSPEPIMSQKDIDDICAKSANSALRDFASLFRCEDLFKTEIKQEAEMSAESLPTVPDPPVKTSTFKDNNTPFFDKLKEKLLNRTSENFNLTCQYCGRESKCLTELSSHQKLCGKEQILAHNLTPVHSISSSRCHYCRQRCKSNTDLYNHLKTCQSAAKFVSSKLEVVQRRTDEIPSEDLIVKVEEVDLTEIDNKPHTMGKNFFVCNNIEAPLELDEEDQHYDFAEDKQEDNALLDLSVRTKLPNSESIFLGMVVPHSVSSVSNKVPTHGYDISVAQVAQHKRVFECPHCSFWALTHSRFDAHIVKHLNKKPFKCSLCARKSNWRWDITKHIKLKSVRDPAHERAKVLKTDETGHETGRCNYTKYNKYLTEIPVTGKQNETSGCAGTRHKANHENLLPPRPILPKPELPKLLRASTSNDFSPSLRSPLKPPPPLKATDELFYGKLLSEEKKNQPESKKTLWKCKMCNLRYASHEKLLNHVKGHYLQDNFHIKQSMNELEDQSMDDEAGDIKSRGHALFRCGHCPQVSNWKHSIQRHCQVIHSGDIRVIVESKNGSERLEVDEQIDEPDHVDLSIKQNAASTSNKIPPRPNDHFSPSESSLLSIDPQFGTLMHGNPKFIYPTYLKNGRMKQKRYKCHKCPSAFEKREQCQVHLTLHGAKQRYKCDHCDYSVKYYANYVQHLKKHQMNADAQAARNSEDSENKIVNEENKLLNDLPSTSRSGKSTKGFKQSIAERQVLREINQRRRSSGSSVEEPMVKEKKLFWCASCPYTNYRKVTVRNHNKRHISISGYTNNYTCEHCDYSVPQAHFLREHIKLHFTQNKVNKVDDYMICENLKLTSAAIESSSKDDEAEDKSDVASDSKESVIFDNRGGSEYENLFFPNLNLEVIHRLINIDKEEVFVSRETGEMIEKSDKIENDESSPMDEIKISEDGIVSTTQIDNDI